ncbi:hypothetical protein ACFY93_31870 [Streptomyces sp. NPDC008313]|uniref:hypothetical protein n=1 Tax=Streptomyces sp. NPDC008313 TaxID=3364826 RepID=UPI0036E96963
MLISDSARVVAEAEAAKNGNGFVVAPVMRNLMTHAVAMAWLVDERTAYPDLEVVRLPNEIRNTADLMAAFGEQEGSGHPR